MMHKIFHSYKLGDFIMLRSLGSISISYNKNNLLYLYKETDGFELLVLLFGQGVIEGIDNV
jgi:hypothetical protein